MNLYQYRVLDTDDEGDPLDHGVVCAKTLKEAVALVGAHLAEIISDEEVEVRFYELIDAGATGVLASKGFKDRMVKVVGTGEAAS